MTFWAKPIMSPMKKRHSRGAGSDMNRLILDEWAQLRAQSLVGNQIDRDTKQIFQVEQNTEIALRGRRAVESDQNVDVAVAARSVTRGGTEQREPCHSVTRSQHRLALREQFKGTCSIHWRSQDRAVR